MMPMLNRRSFLTRSLIGCSLAASPLVTPVSFAAGPWDNRLVVIILRGAMDGLDAVQPVGDARFAALRGTGRAADPWGATGFFGFHPGLAGLAPLWRAGELRGVHAVSTPYRDARSHFDGQDLLEAGTVSLGPAAGRDGWLNRLLQAVPGATAETAYAVGLDTGLVLTGDAPVMRWSPDSDLALSPQAIRLAETVMAEDPRFAQAFAQALQLAEGDGDPVAMTGDGADMMSAMQADMQSARRGQGHLRLADFAAQRLQDQARIAAFSIGGWDTHDNQQTDLTRALETLSETILRLQSGLGPVWSKTAVLVMTEFGRTVRVNGTRGTDHGTGGAMLMAGGALRGADVVADWPGLAEADLYDRRDLMPTRDVRAHAAWVMRGLFGVARSDLERIVFPGLDLGADPRHVG